MAENPTGNPETGLSGLGRRMQNLGPEHPRAVGSPLPMGSGGRAPLPQLPAEPLPPPPPLPAPAASTQARVYGNSLANTSPAAPPAQASASGPSALQRAVSAIRTALPYVQRILPLIDGNIATTVANFLVPHSPHIQQQPTAPPVDLEPLNRGLEEMRITHQELRDQLSEQNSSLKRVEDQLETVREATDRNTLEQQELIEDLKAVSNKLNIFAWVAMSLLTVSLALNVVLYLHLRHIIP